MIPIFIITCDRLEMLKNSMRSYHDCIAALFEIVICDQGSTFKPMVEFLDKLEFEGIRINRWEENPNYGKEKNLRRDDAKISEDVWNYFATHPESNYVVTDADILLDNVNGDVLDVYAYFLEKFPQSTAVGLMLRIDDIPDHYPLKKEVRFGGWEAFYHSRKVNPTQYKGKEIKYVLVRIDTTFAMNRAGTHWRRHRMAARVLPPYGARHLEWYLDPENLTPDQKYYMEHASRGITHTFKIKDKRKGGLNGCRMV